MHIGVETDRAADLGIQRRHDKERSAEIGRFVEFGYPWSTLSESKQRSAEYHDLRKPGWLPTAIVVNILTEKDARDGRKVDPKDVVIVEDSGATSQLRLPYPTSSRTWQPSSIPPLEVIDGQHRLWAFESDSDTGFEVPVVAFHGLDLSWQAYLFWTINIKPKRINASLAFDLYPLLRAEDWLDRAEGHSVYRETRSQELTEALWSHPESPWYDRINMLGEPKVPWVSQAAWIRSLMATYVRPWRSGARVGGLFGSRLGQDGEVLGWTRAQQAAFLIFAWKEFHDEVHASKEPWTLSLRGEAAIEQKKLFDTDEEKAFYGPHTLITTDQGVRGFLHVTNDLCFTLAPKLELQSWEATEQAAANDERAVTRAISSLSKLRVAKFLKTIAGRLVSFDWRTSAAKGISEEERRLKLVFRGSSGYREIRNQLLQHLASKTDEVGTVAKRVLAIAE